jgi:farnesyl-diphosphate farnesyltransferase
VSRGHGTPQPGERSGGDATMDPVRLLRATSRTFAIGIERLRPPLRESVRTAYLLLRVSDLLEDHPALSPREKAGLLEQWEAVLAGRADHAALAEWLTRLPDAGPDSIVGGNLGLVLAELGRLPARDRECLIPHVRRSTLGMARWAARGADFGTEADLDDYMHEVAGRVGWLLTELFALHYSSVRRNAERLMPLGRQFGLGLQTINIIRGLPNDRLRGWVYVPRTLTADLGFAPLELFERAPPADRLVVLERLAAKADRHLAGALEYVTLLPRHLHAVRVFCLLPLFFAVATLRVTRSDPEAFGREAKIDRAEVQRIVRATRLRGWSNTWVRRYAAALEEMGAVSSSRPASAIAPPLPAMPREPGLDPRP